MDSQKVIAQTKALRSRIQTYGRTASEGQPSQGAQAQVCEFLRNYAGQKTAFTNQAEAAGGSEAYLVATLSAILDSFVEYLEAGLATGLSPERQAQLDVVSDVLGQAQLMLDDRSYHPAAAAVLVGASLEEFLRTWVEAAGISIGNAKPTIDSYCKALRTADLISKQDLKDITSWAGIRNNAAHGEWDQVADWGRVRLMLEGVNLFMRQKRDAWKA